MIGQALNLALRAQGWEVHVLTRNPRAGEADPNAHHWEPGTPLALDDLGFFDAMVNLAGSTIARMPWTAKRRAEILHSRIAATTTLVDAMARATRPPKVFVSASAVGYYGDRGDELLTESSAAGSGFLADVCRAWEESALATPAATRTVIVRIGLVIWKNGALAPLRAIARMFLAGPVGGGRSWWPWVSLRDVVRILSFAVTERVSGAINAVGPTPATSGEVVRAIATHLGRPYWFPAPAWGIRLLLGRAGRELLLSSQKVEPRVLLDAGFEFSFATVDRAVAEALD